MSERRPSNAKIPPDLFLAVVVVVVAVRVSSCFLCGWYTALSLVDVAGDKFVYPLQGRVAGPCAKIAYERRGRRRDRSMRVAHPDALSTNLLIRHWCSPTRYRRLRRLLLSLSLSLCLSIYLSISAEREKSLGMTVDLSGKGLKVVVSLSRELVVGRFKLPLVGELGSNRGRFSSLAIPPSRARRNKRLNGVRNDLFNARPRRRRGLLDPCSSYLRVGPRQRRTEPPVPESRMARRLHGSFRRSTSEPEVKVKGEERAGENTVRRDRAPG